MHIFAYYPRTEFSIVPRYPSGVLRRIGRLVIYYPHAIASLLYRKNAIFCSLVLIDTPAVLRACTAARGRRRSAQGRGHDTHVGYFRDHYMVNRVRMNIPSWLVRHCRVPSSRPALSCSCELWGRRGNIHTNWLVLVIWYRSVVNGKKHLEVEQKGWLALQISDLDFAKEEESREAPPKFVRLNL